MPTLDKMVRDFAKASVRSAKSGFKKTPKHSYLVRRHRCERCTDKKTCPHCNCVLWLKCSMATEKCPLGHWPEYTGEDEREYEDKVRQLEGRCDNMS